MAAHKIALISEPLRHRWATAEKFAGLGMHLILCGRRQDRLGQLQQQLSRRTEVITLAFDVGNYQQTRQSVDGLPEAWKKIDILVNNAGNAHGLSPLLAGEVRDWDAMSNGNVQGLLYVSKAVVPYMTHQRGGHIVNLSSVAGKTNYTNGTVYCAAKKAVEAISEGMRLELTALGIKVTNIAPGAVETEFSLVRFKGDLEKGQKVYEGFEPLKPGDIADVIVYAVTAPGHVTIADLTIYPAAQSSPTTIHRNGMNL
jgi:NADP-dependent 3-hydroxy acid dehydrogenase YdfG